MTTRHIFAACLVAGAALTVQAEQVLSSADIRVTVDIHDSVAREVYSIRHQGQWVPALDGSQALRLQTPSGLRHCTLQSAKAIPDGLLLSGDCGVGTFEQRLKLTEVPDVLDVQTRLVVKDHQVVNSMEDRYDFLPERNAHVDEHTGPLDFVWSQNVKREKDDLIPTNGFKSPAVMLQQGPVFVALLPQLSDRHVETRALDLDVTSEAKPWISFGAIPSQPHDHSYFRRAEHTPLVPIWGTIAYNYSIVLSSQPERAGYRRVVRLLWERMGHPALLASQMEQQNPLRPELSSFDSWRQDAWHTYADRIYASFPCGDRQCGTLASNRNPTGDWNKTEPDAWFNAWFQTLRTAYGWYLYGRENHDPVMMARAESVLNLALTSPQQGGAFPTIYLLKEKRWLPGDGWAGYGDSYHAFSMSWTAYWMLRWADDLVPERKQEILKFVRPYGDFLLHQQQPSGVIPSWYLAADLAPRKELRDLNAETGASALFLVELAQNTNDPRYLHAADHAMDFVQKEVVPRQRWFDFETYLSCARKDFDFFDPWTAQYPQNNLAEMQNVQAMLALYQATHERRYLDTGTQMLDYLLLTQQVWNNPQFTPMLLGGFTTQNTDAEWSDARQGYMVTLLTDYYRATGSFELLERATAAARSTFAVAPWENWAHTGYIDQPGAFTGFHWGTGSAMTSVEILAPSFGDAFIDLKEAKGVGIDECTLSDVRVEGKIISFNISSGDPRRSFLLRVSGAEPSEMYTIRWNHGNAQQVSGSQLAAHGFQVGPVL